MRGRYFVQRKAFFVADEDIWPTDIAGHIPSVADHVATDTGLLDQNGDPIMRAPNEMGFIWSDDK